MTVSVTMTTVSRAVVLGTYRRALRVAASLPSADARAYYAANTRQQFAGHADEVDAARIGHLLRRAEEGIVFVRNKVRALIAPRRRSAACFHVLGWPLRWSCLSAAACRLADPCRHFLAFRAAAGIIGPLPLTCPASMLSVLHTSPRLS